jgi:Flagellar hook-length control protein FliK
VSGDRGVARPPEPPLPVSAAKAPPTSTATAASVAAAAPEQAPALTPAATPAPAPATAPALEIPVQAIAAGPAETAASGPPPSGVLARATNALSGDVSRPLELPRVPVPVFGGAALAAEAEAAAEAVSRLAAGATEPTDAAPVPAAGGRVHHPALAAALRAFQQAGPVAAGAEPSPVLQQAQGEDLAVVTPATPGRLAALAGSAADGPSAIAPDRRPLVMPALVVPGFGGDVRVTSDRVASAQFEPHGLTVLDAADGDAVHAQIVQSLRVQWAGGAGEARVRLRPEYLGEVIATVKVEQGTVTATLQADRPEVRRWMEANTQTLRDGLVEHGLKLDRLVVVAEPARGENADDKHGRGRGRQPQAPPQQRQRRPRQNSDTAFELNT